jgi:peptidyl-prolyl cis-trans isomerase B (cyclophilin B)
MKPTRRLLPLAIFALALGTSAAIVCAAAKKKYTEPPKMTIDKDKTYLATIETDKGKIVCELFPKEAPITVNSFVFLARDGFFDNVTFHRVEDWVIQGGDPDGTGEGGPGYQLKNEAANNTHKHKGGTLAMARTPDPDSAGSQFYILTGTRDRPDLDGKYTIFGQVTEGLDVVKKIARGDVIKTIKIEEKEAK